MSNSNCLILMFIIFIESLIISQSQNPPPTVENQNNAEKVNNVQSEEQDKKQAEIMNLMEDFNNEWENKMIDYNSEYDYNIPLKPRIQEIYYENVTTVPSKFKGAFIISEETTDKIEFIVKNPNDKNIYQVIKHHDIFEIPITEVGKYKIIFNNRVSKNNLVVTFTMSTGQNNLLNAKDLTKTEQKLEALSMVIKKFNLEFKFGHDIHTKRYKSKFYIYNIIYRNK